MTDIVVQRVTLADKVNRLFDVHRARDESEQSIDDVAASVSRILGRRVAPEEINALRVPTATDPDVTLLEGVVRHFSIPLEYLTTDGPRAGNLDRQLRLLAAARNAGVKRLALRRLNTDDASLQRLLDEIEMRTTDMPTDSADPGPIPSR